MTVPDLLRGAVFVSESGVMGPSHPEEPAPGLGRGSRPSCGGEEAIPDASKGTAGVASTEWRG